MGRIGAAWNRSLDGDLWLAYRLDRRLGMALGRSHSEACRSAL